MIEITSINDNDRASGPNVEQVSDTNSVSGPSLLAKCMEILLGRKAAYIWTGILLLGFLVLDAFLPLGVAAGVPYAVAVMAAMRTSNTRFIIAITFVSVLFTSVGLFVSPDGGEVWKVTANRVLAIFVIIGAGAFSVYAIAVRRRVTHQAIMFEQVRRRRVQEANVHLIRSAEARSDFLVQISHELRTPLTSITTFSHILDQRLDSLSKERIKSHSEVINRSARRLEVLIDDLFDASGTETGEFKLNLASVDLPQVVSDTVKDYAHQVRIRDQELVVELDITNGQKFHALADPARIAQVVTNLISNASKYSWPGSKIVVFCGLEDMKYIVKVSDKGEGIVNADMQKMFTPFFRADTETVRSVPGAGLGLTIARSIVELHDGTISIESKLGAGTTVTFTIPAKIDES